MHRFRSLFTGVFRKYFHLVNVRYKIEQVWQGFNMLFPSGLKGCIINISISAQENKGGAFL